MFAYNVCHGLQLDSRMSTRRRRRLILPVTEKSFELQFTFVFFFCITLLLKNLENM